MSLSNRIPLLHRPRPGTGTCGLPWYAARVDRGLNLLERFVRVLERPDPEPPDVEQLEKLKRQVEQLTARLAASGQSLEDEMGKHDPQ